LIRAEARSKETIKKLGFYRNIIKFRTLVNFQEKIDFFGAYLGAYLGDFLVLNAYFDIF
jgi:hypothetical protein